jgi:HK97 family phage portal protein
MRFTLVPFRPRSGKGEAQAILHPADGGGLGEQLGQYGILGSVLPSSNRDWIQDIEDPALNYAVFACLRWISDNLPEPEKQVVDRKGREKTPRETHPLLDLLERPNEFYDGDALFAATARDYSLTGNAYWLIERDNLGRPVRLWYVPFWMIGPRWPHDGSQFITDYIYRPSGQGKGIILPREDVVHFQWGLDSKNGGRTGTHRTLPVFPWLASLNEGAVYTASILRNLGVVPNLLIAKTEIGDDQKSVLKEWFQALFTRDNRGKVGVLNGVDADLKQLGLSPQDLALGDILQRPELAVCATFGIPPSVIYLGSTGGPNAFDNGGQHAQARRAGYQDCLMPMTKRFGKTITHRLLPAWEEQPPSQVFYRWDFSEVEALAEDQSALYERNNKSVAAGWMMVSEARERAKLPVDDSHKVFLRPGKSTMVRSADEMVAPPALPDAPSDAPADHDEPPGRPKPKDDEDEDA